jgi:hypothetical protein
VGGRGTKSTRPVSIYLPPSIALLATDEVDEVVEDVDDAIEISSLSPLIPTDGAN